MSVIYNKDFFAVGSRITLDGALAEIDIFATYGTKYGLFIPTDFVSDGIIDWLESDFKLRFTTESEVNTIMLHVSNIGKMFLVNFSSSTNLIYKVPHSTKRFLVANGFGCGYVTESYLIENCETITQCIDVLEKRSPKPMIAPQIFAVDDWVEYAKQKGYKNVFYRRKFYDSVMASIQDSVLSLAAQS